jgi:hypothetical protein
VHRFDNNTSLDVKVLCMVTPAAGGPPDRAKTMEIMLRYGLTQAAPPVHA